VRNGKFGRDCGAETKAIQKKYFCIKIPWICYNNMHVKHIVDKNACRAYYMYIKHNDGDNK
jgi:hypothetical protein